MKRIFTGSLILCLTCTSLAQAFSLLPVNLGTPRFYIGVGAGDVFYKVNGNNYLGTGEGWPDDHYTSNDISNQPSGFVAAGYTWQRDETWLPNYSLGLRYMYVSPTTVSGYIDQYTLPGFRNYHFSYDVELLSLLAVLKADLYRWHNWMPYVLLGAGAANYGTSDYTEQASSGVTPRVNPAFGNTSGNNFAYQLGAGVDYAVRENLVINLEYDYMDYGTVSTDKGTNYTMLTGSNYDNESLKNKISATSLFLSLTYYIE
jgi:opacity protein-like surface antigen